MSLQFSTTYRNALLDALETTVGTSGIIKIRTGSAPANCAAADSGTALAEFDLASDWAAAASSGQKQLNNLTLSTTGGAAGIAAHFRLYASNGSTCHMQGTVTATGGGGDMTVDNTSIANGQAVQITGFTLTAPGP
jgi:hypothetical protein